MAQRHHGVNFGQFFKLKTKSSNLAFLLCVFLQHFAVWCDSQCADTFPVWPLGMGVMEGRGWRLEALSKTPAGITRSEPEPPQVQEKSGGLGFPGTMLGTAWGHAWRRAPFALPGAGGGNAAGCTDLIKPKHGLYLHRQV